MRAQGLIKAVLILLAAGGLAAGQDLPAPASPEPPEPLFVRLSVYPTASLSRYDYNNDLDLYEIRIYVELRRASQEGPALADAVITSFGEKLDYVEDHYEKRIAVDRSRLPAEVEIGIAAKGRAAIKERFPLPAWLVLGGAEAGRGRSRKGPPGALAVQPLPRPRRRPRVRFPDRDGIPAAGPRGGGVGRHPGLRPPPLDHRPHLCHPILALQALSERPGLRPRVRGQRHPLVPGFLEDEMRALPAVLALLGFGLVAPFAAASGGGAPQVVPKDELRSIAPNVFLDCERRTCDFEYIKTEITFVNYVLDRQSADVHIIVTRQQTGSGGNEYTLAFMGLRKHEGRNATLRYYSKPTDTEDQFRRGLVNVIKQGLIPYVYDTPLAEFISISYAQKKDFRPTPASDPWHYWVFGLSARGNGEFEDQLEGYSYQVNASANRTTEAMKFRLYAGLNFNHHRYEIPGEETIVSDTKRKSLSNSVFKSIDGHWSWGGGWSLYSSTYDNARLYTSAGPSVEYNVFPYAVATRRELRVQYRLAFSSAGLLRGHRVRQGKGGPFQPGPPGRPGDQGTLGFGRRFASRARRSSPI